MKKILDIDEYMRGKKQKAQQKVTTKYYIADQNHSFYYSESGNKKIE